MVKTTEEANAVVVAAAAERATAGCVMTVGDPGQAYWIPVNCSEHGRAGAVNPAAPDRTIATTNAWAEHLRRITRWAEVQVRSTARLTTAYAATCQYGRGIPDDDSPPLHDAPATVRVEHYVACYGWSVTDVCARHVSAERGRVYPEKVRERAIPRGTPGTAHRGRGPSAHDAPVPLSPRAAAVLVEFMAADRAVSQCEPGSDEWLLLAAFAAGAVFGAEALERTARYFATQHTTCDEIVALARDDAPLLLRVMGIDAEQANQRARDHEHSLALLAHSDTAAADDAGGQVPQQREASPR